MDISVDIIYQDEYIVAINKPHGLLVHRTKIAEEKKHFALQIVRDLTGRHVHPIHRLDRGTAGVLLFAFDKTIEVKLKRQFEDRSTKKYYLAITRGFLPNSGIIDKPLSNPNNGNKQEALTGFQCLDTSTLNVQIDKYPNSRFSLGLLSPKTGRFHQIRRHLNHISHPIIGDYKHGDFRQNHYFRDVAKLDKLMLHALQLSIEHPVTGATLKLEAPLQNEFLQCLDFLGLSYLPEDLRLDHAPR